MKIKDLKKLLDQFDDETMVLGSGSDHSFRSIFVRTEKAVELDGSWYEPMGDDELSKSTTVLVIN
jgi:hypothetical protein